jgi:hypothetical protein
MATLYAIVTSIEEGKVAEAELEHRVEGPDNVVQIVNVTIRKEIRPWPSSDL